MVVSQPDHGKCVHVTINGEQCAAFYGIAHGYHYHDDYPPLAPVVSQPDHRRRHPEHDHEEICRIPARCAGR